MFSLTMLLVLLVGVYLIGTKLADMMVDWFIGQF